MTPRAPVPASRPSALPVATGRQLCPHCGGDGYVIFSGHRFAEARACVCLPPCSLCQGMGMRLVERDGVKRMARCRCQIIPDRVVLFNQTCIPARHARSSFRTWRNDVSGAQVGYKHAQGWVEHWRDGEENRGLILFGEVGRGKTHLLVSIVRALVMEHGVAARFVEFSHLISDLKAGFDEGVGESVTLQPLIRIPVLAIDELGKGKANEWEMAIIDGLVSQRYNTLATILATTNFTPGAATGAATTNLTTLSGAWRRNPDDAASEGGRVPTLGDRLGDRVTSRLDEMCAFAPVIGDDFRRTLT